MAKRKPSNQHGSGCLVQVIGVIAVMVGLGMFVPQFAWLLYILCGIVLLVTGWLMDKSHVCGDCGNRIELTSRICPTCKVQIGKASRPPIVDPID